MTAWILAVESQETLRNHDGDGDGNGNVKQ